MAYITVDIDIDEFYTNDLVNELVTRKDLSNTDIHKITVFLNRQQFPEKPRNLSMLDEAKWQLFAQKFEEKTLEEFEQFFAS